MLIRNRTFEINNGARSVMTIDSCQLLLNEATYNHLNAESYSDHHAFHQATGSTVLQDGTTECW